jgi:molybdopterin-binding protein
MRLSARNELRGVVKGVKTGAVMAEIVVDVEPGTMVAAITDTSRRNMDLKDGDEVVVVVKATEVMIGKE